MIFRARPFRLKLACLIFVWLCALCGSTLAHAADAEVTTARLEASEEGVRLVSTFSFELSHALEDALAKGVPVAFTTEVEVTRPRWYWMDEKTLHASQTVKLAYNLWTRQYRATINDGIWQSFASLDEALALVLRPRRWLVADKGVLTPGATYSVAVRLRLDLNQLPKPFLITALNNSDWRLSSDWKRFTYKAEEK